MLFALSIIAAADVDIRTPSNETVARQYLRAYPQLKTSGQRYQAVLNSLLELAVYVDTAATRNEIEYLIGGEVNDVLQAIEKKDSEMKAQFAELESDVAKYKKEISELVHGVADEIRVSMKGLRKGLFEEARKNALGAFDENRMVGEKVQKRASKSVMAYIQHSAAEGLGFFAVFQVLIIILIVFYCKYLQRVSV